jgi:hypothetical protein
MFLLFKERRPFKLKKEYPSEQWQIISFRLIPLKTPVRFRWTVPLMILLIIINYIIPRETMVDHYTVPADHNLLHLYSICTLLLHITPASIVIQEPFF